jgi:predicted Zn-ribbon and HTH transcriptional regulator
MYVLSVMAIKSNIQDFRPTREKFSKKIRLLSGGFTTLDFFPKGEITIFPWDSKMDDWVVKNQGLPPNEFLVQAVQRVVPLNQCPVQKLVYSDVQTILLVSRAMRNNSVYAHQAKCPSCGFVHPEDIIRIPDDMEMVGVKADGYVGHDTFTLPDCNDEVSIRPLTVGDIQRLDQRTEIENSTVRRELAELLWGVVAVGGGKPDSLEELDRWYGALSPADQLHYNLMRRELDPHLSPEIKYQCNRCKVEFSVPVQLDSEFFRQRIRKGPVRQVAQSVAGSD